MASEKWTRQLAQIECNRRGWRFFEVSYYDSRCRRTRDLFGFLDALAFPGEGGTVGLQYTSLSNIAARRRKVEAHENLPAVLLGGWAVLVWGFCQKTGRLREIQITEGGGA